MSSIHTESISYTASDEAMQGYLAYDTNAEGQRPGVLVLPEWWGVNDYIRERAEQIAALGYTALAVDMYGGGKTAHNPDEAGAMMNSVLGNMEIGTARLEAAYRTLLEQPTVDGERIGAIGFCFGGAMALHMARIGMPLSAVVSFHGALGSFHALEPGSVKARVLVCHGAADVMIPEEDVRAFKVEMDAAGANYNFIAYEGALHGFTSREADINGEKFGIPVGYNEVADRESWQAMKDLFEEVF
jgi:dienelactone hydrolase